MSSSTTDYTNIYLTQFFTTLGQVSAVVVSTSVVVPMWNFYNMSHSAMWLYVKETILTNWDYMWYSENCVDEDNEKNE